MEWWQHHEDKVARHSTEIQEIQHAMSALTDSVTALSTSIDALEKRIIAHEASAKTTSDALQAQITLLQAGSLSPNASITALSALKTNIDNFEADQPAVPALPVVPVTPVVTPSAPTTGIVEVPTPTG